MNDLKPITRAWFVTAGILDFLVFLQLFVFTGNTQRFFAWTIQAPLTEAFMGAAYGAGSVLLFLSLREGRWANARIALPSVLVFTMLTLIATLLHLDKFHLGPPHQLTAMFFGWFWLLIYVVTPAWQALVLMAQHSSVIPARSAPMPQWLRLALAAHAVLLLIVGLPMFVLPELIAPVWLWPLTPLTGRMVAAWLIGAGLILVHALLDGDLRRVRNGMAIYAIFSVLQGVALARFASEVRWAEPLTWLYVIMLMTAVILGSYTWVAASKVMPPRLESTHAHR
jgi:hypothetical protein